MKKLLILLMALSLAGLAFADVIIGSGTSTGRYPLNDYFVYSRSQCIYLSSEISANPGTITALQWYRNDTGADPNAIGTTEIWLTETPLTTLSTWQTEGTLVATISNIDLGSGGGWYNVDIADFDYSGGNLMVSVRTQNAPYTSPHSYWRYTSTSTYLSLLGNSDGTNPPDVYTSYSRPNITFVGIDVAVWDEPTNHVTDFAAGTIGYTSIPLTWTGSTGAQLPGNYLIQAIKSPGTYATVTDGTPVANDAVWTDNNAAINVVHVDGANTYTFTGLAPNTAYEFKIWPYTNSGANINFKVDDPIPTVNASTLDATIYAEDLPYPQNFDSVTPPALPDGWLSLDNNADGDKWVTSTINPRSTPNAARIYTDYNTVNDDYLVTPRVELTGNQRLKFWTRAHSTGEPDEISILLSSTTPEAANFTLEAMSTTAVNFTTYAEYTVDLSAYSGFHYIAFARKNAPADGWYLYIDDVLIENIPQTAVFQIDPDLTEPWPFGLVPVGGSAEKMFRITNIGGGTLTINSITSDNDPPFSVVEIPTVDHSLSANEYTDFKIVFTPQTTGGPYSATVTVDYGEAKTQYQIQFTGSAYQPATLPLTEGWESGQGNWSFVNGTQTNAWYIGAGDATYTPYAGSNFAYISNDGGNSVSYTVSSTSVSHIYTDIAFDADCLEFPLSFYWRCQGEGTAWDRMRVHLVDTSVTPVAGTELTTGQVGLTNYNLQPAWTAESITLPGTLSGTVKRLVFSWKNDSSGGTNPPINLDNISLTATPNPTGPVLPPNLVYPVDRQDNLPLGGFAFQFSWNTGGSEPDQYNLYLANLADLTEGYTSDDFFGVATAYEDVTSPFDPAITYGYSETYVWTVGGYNAAYPTEVYLWPPYEYTTEPDPTITIPHTQDFGTDGTWPNGWTQSYSGGVTSNRWTVSNTANAGGTANEMMCTWASGTGISRLITPPINTDGIANFSAQFNHYYNDYAVGATAKVQYSHDLATWYDTNWTLASGGGDDLGQRTALVLGINQPITYVAWVMDGNHFQFDNWYVDDVVLDLMPEHDVAPISISGVMEVADAATPIYPTAQVANLGVNVETFTVTATWDTYTDQQTVTDLGIGQIATVTFASFTPNTYIGDYFTVTTNLATDVNTANDVLQTPLVTLPLDRPALASNLWSDYLVAFNLKDPGTLTDLIDKSAYQSLYAGDWMNGKWYACEDYDDVNLVGGNFWQIDPPAGTMTDLGDGTTSMHGLAWDDVNGVLYGHDAANLYTLNPATGAILTTVGPHGITYEAGGTVYDGLVISIAYDNFTQTLYAVELGTGSLYTLNVTTGAATKVGAAEDWLGIDVNYAQDMAFDQDTGLLYLAGYTNSTQGALYWIDTTYGYAWKVGPFQGSSEMDAFAIPYGDAFVGTPDVTIAADGTLSWPAINGAAGYYVYAADDPYGTYTKIATVYDLSWLDPNFPETMKFYQVVAFGGRAAGNSQADVSINPALRKTGNRAAGEVTASPADRNQRQLKK